MKNLLITATTFTVLLAAQTAMANDDGQEFLGWLNSGHDVVQVDQSLQFNKVSMMSESNTKADAFSLDFSSDK